MSDLGDRIRSEAEIADRPGQMDRLNQIADEVDRLKRGAETLGQVVEKQCQMVLDVTGRHDLIGDDGDGDWGAVWDHLYELRRPCPVPCCTNCGGTGADMSGPCSDCLGTGHPHAMGVEVAS